MFHLEVLTNERRIVFFCSLFVGELLLLFLISGGTLDVDVIVFDGPRQIIRVADQLEHILPRLLRHLKIGNLARDIGSKHYVDARSRGYRVERRTKVHIHELEIVQFIIWGGFLCNRRSEAERNQRNQ